MNLATLLPLIVSSVSTIKTILDVAQSNEDIVKKITKSIPGIASLLTDVASQLFPNVKKELQIAAGAMAAFDPDITKWIQGALNVLLDPSPNLTVDGIYGPKTAAAVEQLQKANGLYVDGWAGELTKTLIAKLLAARPQIG